MRIVTKTSDNNTYQTANLGTVSGTIYVRVIDNNRVQGQNNNNTLKIDHMYIDGGVPPTEPPTPAINPDPVDGVNNVQVEPILSWTAGTGAESHDVYFGTDPDGLPFIVTQDSTTYTPGKLDPLNTYYWRIDEVNIFGQTMGEVWSFTTQSEPADPTSMHVDSIQVSTVSVGKGKKRGQVTVTIFDDYGSPVSGAEVTGIFTGDYIDTVAETTDEYGTVVLTTVAQARKPSYTFCVDDVRHDTLTYDPYDDLETCKSK